VGLQATATHTGHGRCIPIGPVPADSRQTRYVRLAALPSAVPWARRVLRHMLREWQLQGMAEPAALLVSELVTNAVEASAVVRDHGKLPMIGLAIRLTAASLVLEVWDASPARPVPQKADIAADHGRGLILVDALADAWGHRAAPGGKVVWCELAIPSLSARTSLARWSASILSPLVRLHRSLRTGPRCHKCKHQ
jgi:anti-sigma regulatory factor (Ser/Thr protein kinase)